MYKYVILIVVLFGSCKKHEETPRIKTRQQPTKITIFSLDTATNIPTLMYDVNYFYNDSMQRFDSIAVAGKIYRFNYTQLLTEHKVLLNYTSPSAKYEAFVFDTDFYALKQYTELPTTGDAFNYTLQYDTYKDTYKRIMNLSYSTTPSNQNYTQEFSYKNDSIFMTTSMPYNTCENKDTIINSIYDMNTNIPYLLFLNIHENCTPMGLNLLRVIPISNYSNKLPSKISNGKTESVFTYIGDSNYRLSVVNITTRNMQTNLREELLKIVVTY